MPRPKAAIGGPGIIQDPDSGAIASDDGVYVTDEVLDLLRWVARSIQTINMGGKKMTNKCLLCPVSRLHREPCRHEQIWKLAGL